MDVQELLHRLEKHEAECVGRMELINLRLESHDASFAKLERYVVGGFAAMGTVIVLTIAILEFAR